MTTIVNACRGLVPAVLCLGLCAQPIPNTRATASTPLVAASQDAPDGAVEQLDALIARLRTGGEDRALVRELEGIARKLKARGDRAPVTAPTELTRRRAMNLSTTRTQSTAAGQGDPLVATVEVVPVDQIVEVRSNLPEAKVQVTRPSVTVHSGSGLVPTSGVLKVEGEDFEYRTYTKPEVTMVAPDGRRLRLEVATPTVRNDLPTTARRATPARPATPATPAEPATPEPVVDVITELPAKAESLDAGLADIERELREIRTLIEQIRRKAAQAPKKRD
jgi:hypothetical protein